MTCCGATPRSHLHALTAWAGPRPGDRIEHLALVPPELIPELSSDAPFGPLDPWVVIAAATTRRTASGEVAGLGERITFAQALDAYLAPPGDPGGPPRRVSPGLPADLVVLHAPLAQAARLPDPVRAAGERHDPASSSRPAPPHLNSPPASTPPLPVTHFIGPLQPGRRLADVPAAGIVITLTWE